MRTTPCQRRTRYFPAEGEVPGAVVLDDGSTPHFFRTDALHTWCERCGLQKPRRWRARMGTHCSPPPAPDEEAAAREKAEASVVAADAGVAPPEDLEHEVFPPPAAAPGRRARRSAAEVQLVMDSHKLLEVDGWLRCTECHVRHRPRQRAKFHWCLASVAPPGPA